MSVGQHEEFLSEADNKENNEVSEDDRMYSSGESSIEECESEDEKEISFNENRNRSKRGHKTHPSTSKGDRLRLSDFADECEVHQTNSNEEEESMMKFAKFLEKNGYIQKTNSSSNGDNTMKKR